MPTYHLDLTPFIPILVNGQPHNITFDVASAEPDHQINPNWYLSGLLQVNLDSSTLPTTGNITLYQADDYAFIHIEAQIIAGRGANRSGIHTESGIWEWQTYPQKPLPQQVFQIASGETLSTHNGETALQDIFTYPSSSFLRRRAAQTVASGTEQSDSDGWSGVSFNTFNYFDTEGNTYTRQVNASSNAITFDNQGGTLAPDSSDLKLLESQSISGMKARGCSGRAI
ncbi:hypothetical protein EDB85DRAFT_2158540 [Lactarius pseudohatsudake]|nr:hypothetical protein EDB85DRAFT_2158540 [Lactarius pseudohatsudake]